jgi:hypothetical protein
VAQPMLPLKFFRQESFSACILFGVLMNLSYYGILFVLTLYLQTAHGYSALQTGRQSRTCYGHQAGRLGVALHDALLSRHCIVFKPGMWQMTDSGRDLLASIGLDER